MSSHCQLIEVRTWPVHWQVPEPTQTQLQIEKQCGKSRNRITVPTTASRARGYTELGAQLQTGWKSTGWKSEKSNEATRNLNVTSNWTLGSKLATQLLNEIASCLKRQCQCEWVSTEFHALEGPTTQLPSARPARKQNGACPVTVAQSLTAWIWVFVSLSPSQQFSGLAPSKVEAACPKPPSLLFITSCSERNKIWHVRSSQTEKLARRRPGNELNL